MSNANQPGAMWAGRSDPFVLVSGHLVSPEDGFGEIGRMANGDLRRPGRMEVGTGGIHGQVETVITRFGGTPSLDLRSANGTEAAPTAILNGEALGDLNFIGHDGTAFGDGSRIRGVAAENWAVGAHGAGLDLFSVPIGSAVVTNRWQVQAAGHFVAASDGVVDLGQPGVLRPRDAHLSRNLTMGGIALIGTMVPSQGTPMLDVVGETVVFADLTTDALQKVLRLGCRHFTNIERPVAAFVVTSGAASNTIIFGGGSSLLNTATIIEFRTAANTTTATGTLALDITGVGATSLLHLRGNLRIGALSGTDVSVGINDSGGAGFKLLRVPN